MIGISGESNCKKANGKKIMNKGFHIVIFLIAYRSKAESPGTCLASSKCMANQNITKICFNVIKNSSNRVKIEKIMSHKKM